jgi:hypothetical protein
MLWTAKPRSNFRIRTHVQTEMQQYRLKCGLRRCMRDVTG